MAGQKYASWAAKDTRQAGSLPSDFDSTIIAAQFSKEAPDGYTAQGNPIFGWFTHLIDDAGDYAGKSDEERTLKVAYNLGAKAGDEFTISDDGFGLVPNDDAVASLRGGSKFDMFKCSLENNGVSQEVTQAGTLQALIGMRGHYRRVEDEKLLGKKREFAGKDERKKNFPDQTLVMVKLLAMPGQKGVAATTSASAPAANASAPAGATAVIDGDLDTQTATYLRTVLGKAKGNTVQRSQLVAMLSKEAIKAANRKEIAARGTDEAFLAQLANEGIVLGNEFFQVTYDPKANPQMVGLAS